MLHMLCIAKLVVGSNKGSFVIPRYLNTSLNTAVYLEYNLICKRKFKHASVLVASGDLLLIVSSMSPSHIYLQLLCPRHDNVLAGGIITICHHTLFSSKNVSV